MHYNRLTALVLMINLAVFWRTASAGGLWAGNAPGSLLFAAQLNFALAVIVRNQYLHNALFWITTKTPTHWPLTIRWPLAKIYQFGGLHVGGALSGLLWYGVFVASLTELARTRPEAAPTLSLVLSYILVGMFVVMVVMALPPMRARFHDRFEFTHRFFGWASVVLVWVNNLAFPIGQRYASTS